MNTPDWTGDPLLQAYLPPDWSPKGFNEVAALVPFWPAWRGMWLIQAAPPPVAGANEGEPKCEPG